MPKATQGFTTVLFSALFSGLFGAVAFSLTACSDATGTARGGEQTLDASVPAAPPPAASDAGVVTFTELYTAFFGPTGKASCTFESNCHGGVDQAGSQATASTAYPTGYVCGPDKDGCYRNMTGAGLPSTTGGLAPEQTLLYQILRKSPGGPGMPFKPTSVSFSPEEMQRIRTWIAAGAKND